jgi:hypothetical protein
MRSWACVVTKRNTEGYAQDKSHVASLDVFGCRTSSRGDSQWRGAPTDERDAIWTDYFFNARELLVEHLAWADDNISLVRRFDETLTGAGVPFFLGARHAGNDVLQFRGQRPGGVATRVDVNEPRFPART